MVNDISVSSGISSPEQVVNSIPKQSFRRTLCKNVFYFHIFSVFLVFKRDFIRRWFCPYRSFKHSKWWRHKL